MAEESVGDVMRLLLAALIALAACGPTPCSAEYPNETPEGLCCDPAWQWCVAPDGRVVGAP